MENKKILFAMPAYNEEDVIEKTITGVKSIYENIEIVVIDDGSTDNTRKVLENIDGIDIIKFDKNKGKGAGLKEVFNNYEYDYICLLDADIGLTSVEAKKLIDPVINNEIDFTIAKFPERKKSGKRKGFGLVKNIAKKGIYFYTKKEVNNSLSGQRVYKKEIIDSIKYIPNNYGIEVAMTIQAINNGYSFLDIPVNMSHRYSDVSFKGYIHRGKQFWQILKTLIIMFFKR